ncbi:MAG: NADH:ubiquinone oxidoreductase [Alyxoria varia]|nr:MAG: NADH:ubiquinone oxidoreductase [Alyxoria varia]
MPSLDRSSPAPAGFGNLQEEIAYYKSQYEQLEVELQEFQASSRDLEAELERDVEASEKRERGLKEKVESLSYEVDEWKTKYKQSKLEASNAQNALQKEITSLRDTNRSQHLRLRDIEVANDDFERQARHTTSSLEDLESKYNVTLERGVMLEEEIKTGEQERETLRIETQRLRDEFSDLKIEADITQEKLRAAEANNELHPKRVSQLSESKEHGLHSPASEGSVTSASLASNFTPPVTQSESSAAGSDAPTPPSPPLSETFGPPKTAETAPPQLNQQTTNREPNVTPKPPQHTPFKTPHSRSQSRTTLGGRPPTFKPRSNVPLTKPNGVTATADKLPRTESLYQVKGLIGKIQKLEMRVQSAKSKLPAPTNTPPKASPRGANTPVQHQIPSNVTIRSSKKRSSASTNASATPSRPLEDARKKRESRMSYGGPRGTDGSRPSSRASNAAQAAIPRPGSRIETSSGASEGEFKRPQSAADARRPRSSMSGAYTSSQGHRQSQSSYTEGEDKDHQDQITPTPRRLTEKMTGGSAIPAPSGLGRRQSAQALAATPGRRKTNSNRSGPEVTGRTAGSRQSTDLGETF